MSEKIKVVIDTQLFLRAAINPRSLPAKLIFELNQQYELVMSEAILDEIVDVLNRPKLRKKFVSLTDIVVDNMIKLLRGNVMINPPDVPAISRDPKDDKFLACAKVAQAQYIVSEDKDLLVLDEYDGIQIINAEAFLKILQQL